MTKTKASSNGKPRPPDLERWGSKGPQTRAERIEQLLSDGKARSNEVIAELIGSTYKSANNELRKMKKENLISVLPHELDARKVVYRWRYFEAQSPAPKPGGLPEWMLADPDDTFVEGPIGWRCRLAFRWYRVGTNNKVRIEHPNLIPGDLTDKQLEILLEDACEHSGRRGVFFTNSAIHTKPAEISGYEILGYAAGRGIDAPAVRGMATYWLGRVADSYPTLLWPPECFQLGIKGYRINPILLESLKMISAIPGMMPKGCWAPPAEIVRAVVSQAANIWRSRALA